MTRIWTCTDGAWSAASLEGHAFVLSADHDASCSLRPWNGAQTAREDCLLLPAGGEGDAAWHLLSGSRDVRVNGEPMPTGIRALRHRDDILLPDNSHAFFSTDEPAAIVPFLAAGHAVACCRCHSPIDPGTPTVRCPRCRLWHHQDPAAELPCWTYAEACANCDMPTSMDGVCCWTPEDL